MAKPTKTLPPREKPKKVKPVASKKTESTEEERLKPPAAPKGSNDQNEGESDSAENTSSALSGDNVGDEERLQPPAPPAPPEPDDYLRQYQYRKATVKGSKASDPQPGSKAEIMKAELLRQPRIRMLIPRPFGEDKGILHTVNLNGYRLDFPKGAYVDMPEQIANVLAESLDQTNAALEFKRIDGNQSKENALL